MRFSALPRVVLCLAVLCFGSYAFSQVTLTGQTANNTSACSAASGYCAGNFVGLSDAASGTFDLPPGNVSHLDMHANEYSSATTALFVHLQPWFCMQPGSTATGVGTSCNSHIQVGYNSNDPSTVQGQMSDMQARGFQGPIIDWYGPNATIENQTTQLVKSDLEGRCAGTSCPLSFALNEDQGSVTRSCPLNGGGTDQSNCILGVLESDLDYANANYFPSPAYLRIDGTSMKPSSTGRPILFFFFCETCFTNPSPNWSNVWNQLRAHVLSYSSGSPLMWFIFRNSVGFTHTQADGAYGWINHYGSNDPYGLVYLDNFYDTSLQYRTLQPWGAAWKGFDNSLAPWQPAVSLTPQQCGNTWVQTFSEMTHNNDYGPANQLPFLQVATWNDYEEGSEIETGIDNCLSLTASLSGANLTWSPSFSSASGSENTVDHYEIYSTLDGQNLSLLATVPSGTHAVPMSSMNLPSGLQSFYIEAIGKASIQNRMSNAVAYSPAVIISTVSPNSGSTNGGTTVTITGTNFQAGATVSFGGTLATVNSVTASSISAVTPSHAAGVVNVVVTNLDGSGAAASSAYTYSVPALPSFTLSVSPPSRTVTRGTSTTYSVSLTPQNGFTGVVNLSVSGLPAGTSASFAPASLTTSGTAKLNVNTIKTAAKGTYQLTVSGTSNSLSSSATVSLTLH